MEKRETGQHQLGEKARVGLEKVNRVFSKTGFVLSEIGKWILRLHKLFLAAPVVYFALRIADYARENLPEEVGVLLRESGEYAYTLTRDAAVQGSLAVTAVCLLLMFASRRTIYPWLISIFSLVLPIVLVLTNSFL